MKTVSRLFNLPTALGTLLIVLSSFSGFLYSQTYTGNLYILSQTDADNFNYSQIAGNLYIKNGSQIQIDSLYTLQSVSGILEIKSLSAIQSLSGLQNLQTVGGDLTMENLPVSLSSSNGLNSLTSIGGNLRIINTRLSNLDGFSGLDSIGGYLYIQENSTLVDMDGFSSLQHIHDYLKIKNNAIQHIDSVNSLAYVGGWIEITQNGYLKRIDGFNGLPLVKDDFWIAYQSSLTSIDGFNGITQSDADFRIQANTLLSSINGFKRVKQFGNQASTSMLDIYNNPALVSVSGFDSLTHMLGDFRIRDNDNLIHINGFKSLEYASSFSMYGNTSLENLDSLNSLHTSGNLIVELFDAFTGQVVFPGLVTGLSSIGLKGTPTNQAPTQDNVLLFPSLKRVNSGLLINYNNTWKKVTGFGQLDSVGGHMGIIGCKMDSVEAFGNLSYVGGRLWIAVDSALSWMAPMPKLTHIGEGFKLISTGLSDMRAFENLTHISTNADIISNDNLTSLEGLESLTHIGGTLTIENNPGLNDCCALSYYFYQAFPTKPISEINIQNNNGAGCTMMNIAAGFPCNDPSIPVGGSIYLDINKNCQPDQGDLPYSEWPVRANPGPAWAIPDSNGNFTLFLDTLTYQVKPEPWANIDTTSYLVYLCDDSISVVVDTTGGGIPYVGDFGVQLTPCPILKTSVSGIWNRRCFENPLTVKFQNVGPETADSVLLFVRLPQYFEVNSSIPVPDSFGNRILVFELGTLLPMTSGEVQLKVQSPCNNVDLLGIEQTVEAWMTSPSECIPLTSAGWTGASLHLDASCQGDTLVRFDIVNSGLAGMPDSSLLKVYLDTVSVFSESFLLGGEDSLVLTTPVSNQTYRLEVQQVNLHPVSRGLSIAIEGCTNNLTSSTSKGFVSAYPGVFAFPSKSYTAETKPVIGSYDPNDKLVSPSGLGEAHYIPEGTRLRYLIRFQNSGNDTAFFVRLIDTLDSRLDISTFKIEGASHPYTIELHGSDPVVMKVTYLNINLPDDATNYEGSQGYFSFSVRPVESAKVGTAIENYAEIYFDFNPPIVTNTVLNTLWDFSQTIQDSLKTVTVIYKNGPPPAYYGQLVIDATVPYLPVLTWLPSGQITEGYYLERSDDNMTFSRLDTLGASTLSYTDSLGQLTKPLYYRIIPFNTNGTTNPSNIAMLSPLMKVPTQLEKLEVSPNPFGSTIRVVNLLPQYVYHYAFTDLTGKAISVGTIRGMTNWTLSALEIPTGIYFLKISSSDAGGSKTWMMVKD